MVQGEFVSMKSGRGRDKFRKYKWVINLMSGFVRLFPLKIRKKFLINARNTKGEFGLALRYAILKAITKKIGDNVSVHENVYIFSPENLDIGDNVSIHPMCYIDATGGISIGNDVSIAHMVTVMSTTHLFDDTTIPIKDQGCESKRTVIENNVWIGAKTTVLYGVKISQDSILGANSVVNKDVPENVIVGGIPAKIIKERI